LIALTFPFFDRINPEQKKSAFKFHRVETCHATMFKPMLFNFAPSPAPERICNVVGIAVRPFLAAYKV